MVRAKFKVRSCEKTGEETYKVRLEPVYDSNPDSENGKFFKYTPLGQYWYD